MKVAAFIFLVAFSAFAGWETNSTIPALTDLGVLQLGNTAESVSMFTATNGDKHLLQAYDVLTDLSQPIQIVDVNCTQNTIRLTNAIAGRAVMYSEVYLNGIYYRGSSDDGGKSYFWKYNPATGEGVNIGKLSDKTAMRTCISDDGKIYIGTFGHGRVDSYDPATGILTTNLGQLDTNYTGAAQYCYTIGADSRYVYGGMGQSPWYLAVLDTQTGQSWTYWSNETDTASGVYHNTGGGWLYYRGGTGWYHLADGVPTLTNNSAGAEFYYISNNNVTIDSDYFGANHSIWVDLGFAYPDGTNNWASFVYSNYSGTLQTLSVSNFNLSAAQLKRVYADGSNMLAQGSGYLPLMRRAPSGTVSVLGRTGSSIYDIQSASDGWYMSGYSAISYRYLTNAAWGLTASTPDKTAAGVNPRQFSGGWGKYHYYSAMGSDGYLYVGAHHERSSSGGSIGWYDTNTMASVSSYRPVPWEYLTNDVSDLKPILNGSNLVYLASGWPALYVFDTATKTMLLTNSAIMSHRTTLGKCVETSSGVVVGVYGTNVWRFNCTTGVSSTNTIPGTAWSGFTYSYDHRITLGPDGKVWATLDTGLYRIDPDTLGATLVKAATGAHNVTFNGGDAYLYNPTTAELHVITNLLVYSAPAAPGTSGSTIGAARLGAGRF